MGGPRDLRAISIRSRLRIFVGAVLLLMLLGSVLSFSQFRDISGYALRVAHAQHRLAALLRLNNALLTLNSRLHRSAATQDASRFAEEAKRLLDSFERHASEAHGELEQIAKESERHALLVGSIQSMLETLPARVSSFAELARAGDWLALEARLLNLTDRTDDVVAALMAQADDDLADAQKALTEDLERTRQRAGNVLAASAALSLAAAALLGTLVTRSITGPLSDLHRGARALAAGDFTHRVPVNGTDELADLARVFHHTAGELSRLFDEVRQERTAAETARAALEQRAHELARANSDLEQFAYSASHDLQEPVRVIALYSQLLQKKYGDKLDGAAEHHIRQILRNAQQMEQLITDLLAYTRAATANERVENRTDVNVALERVLHVLEPEIRSQNAEITAEPLPTVRAHEVHVQQLLQNLLSNALKYRGDAEPRIHISAQCQANEWMIAVRDNGIGIDPQYSAQIFGVFKRLHGNNYPGTGIGLAICQRIVDGYGGSIWVESEPGEGATFRFTLPAG